MEKWNDKIIRQHIDEIITESYLRCLTEREIRDYLRIFLDSCDCALRNKADSSKDMKLTGIKVALLKGYFLLNGESHPVANSAHNQHGRPSGRKANHELFAEQVVAVRSSILKLLDDYNPKITRAVLHNLQRKRGIRRFLPPGKFRPSVLVYTGYFALFAASLFIILIILFR